MKASGTTGKELLERLGDQRQTRYANSLFSLKLYFNGGRQKMKPYTLKQDDFRLYKQKITQGVVWEDQKSRWGAVDRLDSLYE